LTSLLRFAATSGTTYQVAVDGVNGATGTVLLSYALDAPGTTLTAAATRLPDWSLSTFMAQFHGVKGRKYRVQSSADLVRWQDFFNTNPLITGEFEITDPNLGRLPARFFRVLPLP
jgi:hypothetical protein